MTERFNKNLAAVTISEKQAFLDKARNAEGCVMLAAGEPDFGISDGVRKFLSQAIQHGKTHYVSSEGDYAVRRALADYENRVSGAVWSPEEVIVTVGASEGLYLALQTILNPGDEVIIPLPAIDLYEKDVRLAGAAPVFLDTTEDGFQINREKLRRLITEKTKAIIINSPNNPTGVVYPRDTLDAVAALAKEHGLFVLSDEVYCHVYFDGDTAPSFAAEIPELRDQTIVIKSLSNSNAMSGFRIGCLFSSSAAVERIKALHGAIVTSTVSLFQDAIVETCHTGIAGMMEAYQSRRDYLVQRLSELGLSYADAHGTFYVFADIRPFGIPSQAFCEKLLEETGVAVLPSSFFGVEGFIRISIAAALPELKKGMSRMESFIQGLKE